MASCSGTFRVTQKMCSRIHAMTTLADFTGLNGKQPPDLWRHLEITNNIDLYKEVVF